MTVSTENHTDWDYEAVVEQRDALLAENQRLREEILRCGALAISERADGCVPKTRALQIRKVAYELTSREALAGDAE